MAVKELIEKKLNLVAESRKLIDEHPGDKWTAEVESRYGELDKQLNETVAAIDAAVKDEETRKERAARLDEIERRHQAANGGRRDGLDAGSRRDNNPENIDRRVRATFEIALRSAMSGKALRNPEARAACEAFGIKVLESDDGAYLGCEIPAFSRYGEPAWMVGGNQASRESRAAMDITNAGAGKETIPAGFVYELDRKLLAFGGPRRVCRVIQTASGNSLPYPKVDDTGNSGALLAEATDMGSSVAATTSAVTFGAYKFSSTPILVSSELLQDSAFDLAAELGSFLGERLGRVEGTYTTTGTGSSQPEGIVTGAATGKTAASTTAFTTDELMDLFHSVDPAYRESAGGWMMHDTIVSTIRKFKDSNGQYIWQPGISASMPDLLLGKPITLNQHMDSALTTGKKLVVFGDFSRFIIRDAGSVVLHRLNELYRATDQTGFVAFRRFDSKVIQSAAIKKLVLA